MILRWLVLQQVTTRLLVLMGAGGGVQEGVTWNGGRGGKPSCAEGRSGEALVPALPKESVHCRAATRRSLCRAPGAR